MDTKDKLSKVSLVLHWVVGVLMIYMILSGLTMESLEVRWFFDSHTSLGVLIVVVVIPRIIWRYYNGWPEAMGSYSKLEKIAGKVVHWTLLLCTILMPASGMLLAVAGGHGCIFSHSKYYQRFMIPIILMKHLCYTQDYKS